MDCTFVIKKVQSIPPRMEILTKREEGSMSSEKVVTKITDKFREYNSKLTVIRVIRYGFTYLVIAVYDVSNGFREMDPLYLYDGLTGRITGYCPTANLRRFSRMQKWGKVIYTNPLVEQDTMENKDADGY